MLLIAQTGQNKNGIGFFYYAAITKTNITNYQTVTFSNYFEKHLFKSQAPNKSVYGYSRGAYYQRSLGERLWIHIGFNHSKRGQKSPRFYSIYGIPDSQLRETYGGSFYTFEHQSYEFPLFLRYYFQSDKRLKYFINIGGSLDIYRRFIMQNYVILAETGEVRHGCCWESLFRTRAPFLRQLRAHFKDGLWRVGGQIGGGISYELFDLFSFSLSIDYKHYTNLYDTSISGTVVEGGMYTYGLTGGVAFLF